MKQRTRDLLIKAITLQEAGQWRSEEFNEAIIKLAAIMTFDPEDSAEIRLFFNNAFEILTDQKTAQA